MPGSDAAVPDLGEFLWHSSDLLSVFGADGRLQLVNPAWHDLLGWELEDVRGQPFSDFVHPEDLHQTGHEFDVVVGGPDGTRAGFVNRQRCRDGRYLWIQWYTRRYGEWICATGRDITSREELQARLNWSAAITEAMFESAADSIVILDHNLEVIGSNAESERIFGYPESEQRGRHWLTNVHRDDRADVEAALHRTFTYDELTTLRFRFLHPSGRWLTIDSRGRALRSAGGLLARAVFISRDITEMVDAQAAREESFQKITTIFETAADSIIIIDRDLNALETSPASERITGYPLGSLLGSGGRDLVDPEDIETIFDAGRRVFDEGSTETVRYRMRHADGHLITVESRVRAIASGDERPQHAVMVNRDVSESVATEEALAENLAFRRAIVDSAADSIVVVGNDLVILEASPGTEKIFGYRADERLGESVLGIMHPGDRPAVAAALIRLFGDDSREPVVYEFRAQHARGHWVTIETRGSLLHGATGPRRAVLISRDISESMATQQALTRSLATLRAVLDAAADSIIMIDRDYEILEISQSAESIYGIPIGERRGRSALEVVVPDDRVAIVEQLEGLFEGPPGNVVTYRFHATHRDGRQMVMETRGTTLKVDADTTRAVLITRDITDAVSAQAGLEAAKAEAELANLAKSEFLSRMSHELRTPLNSVLGFAQILQMESDSPDQIEIADQIYTSGRHLLNLINEVMDISRVESGTIAVKLGPVRVADVARECVDIVSPQAKDRGIEVVVGECDAATVVADKLRFGQVLLNLLTNAVKYNRPEGRVTLTCGAVEDRVRISVADTGFGIAPENFARLFSPFDRMGAEARGVEGTGLGLALTKSLTEAMDGTVGCDSVVGEGSVFWVELPVYGGPDLAPSRLDLGAGPG